MTIYRCNPKKVEALFDSIALFVHKFAIDPYQNALDVGETKRRAAMRPFLPSIQSSTARLAVVFKYAGNPNERKTP
jgi:hypothetical protein